ncbi:MAG: CHAT domain-containing protein, partial [Bacteroidota bacterium]
DYDSLEDGMLHTFELFNMNLSAELAVLSACNTGIGKLQKGEGVMSLGRAFSYAGCPSIVMSHWSVDDRSTSELMSLFYKNLSEGKSKDLSLKQAKKEFLNNTDELRTHPLYWAGFVVLGDTKPLTNGSGHQLIYWLIGVVLVILVSSFTINKKLKSQKETSS